MSDEKSKGFNIDSEDTGIAEVPSITRLLNRKSLNLSKASIAEPIAPAPSISLGDAPGSFNLETSSAPQQSTNTQIRRAGARRGGAEQPTLAHWNAVDLKKGTDPMGKALAALVETAGLSFAVFLGIDPASPLKLRATAALAPLEKFDEKKNLWTGIVWDPKVAPEIWNNFLKVGSVELSPPGTLTNGMSSRNVVRGAFGLEQKEWVTLVRVGPATGCRGMVALISNASIQIKLASVIHLFALAPKSS